MENIYTHLLSSDEDIEMMPIIPLNDSEDEQLGKPNESFEDIEILPLKNTVLFPGVVLPISVGREKSIEAVKSAQKKGEKQIVVLSQKNADSEDPKIEDMYEVGVMARIIKLLKMPDGSLTVILQGKHRVKVSEFTQEQPFLKANVNSLASPENINQNKDLDLLISTLKELAQKVISLSPNVPSEASIILSNIEKKSYLLNFISSNLQINLHKKYELLVIDNIETLAQKVLEYVKSELDVLELKNKIKSKVDVDIQKQQREYFLNQQLKVIQEELGGTDTNAREIEDMRARAKEKKWNKTVEEVFNKELARLQRMHPASTESGILHTYIDTLLELPWEHYSEDKIDLNDAQKVLDSDHFGLDKIKQRILEYLAVLKLKGDMKSPILCFVGPPGVGKTSLGKSIAKAMNRQYARIALGGLHDEAEIRGHRKTYIGAMSGRIIQTLKKVKTSNPVFILDEIDKVASNKFNDPSSALLELLDPEQNQRFYDNYLELEYDLSKVMFIATANSLSTIQPALLDRMEIIQISGYAQEEKLQIAKNYLVKKQREAHGLKIKDVKITDKAIGQIIEEYTRESGVRELDRMLASLMRHIAKKVVQNEQLENKVESEHIPDILGPQRYLKDNYEKTQVPGVAIGLAWTSVGGSIIYIESVMSKGAGKLELTGNLGQVMKESAQTALAFIRSHQEKLGLETIDFNTLNIHIHVPEGAVPKDGPSAGITMLTALISLLKGKSVKKNLAMTGEISLRGKVTPVGGIKEKILAAKRAGIKEIILCQNNEKDVIEVGELYTKGLRFHYVDSMFEVLEIAL